MAFGQSPIASTADQVAADWPFVGVLERRDDVRGFVYVGNYGRPTRLSDACRRVGCPPWGDFRVTLEDGSFDAGDDDSILEITVPEPPPPPASAAPVEAAPAAPAHAGALDALRVIVEQQTATIERQEEQIVALRAARDDERRRYLDEVEDWRRRYDGAITDNARLKTEKHEAVDAAVAPLRAQLDILAKALGTTQQSLAVVQAKEELRAEFGDGYAPEAPEPAPAAPSPLEPFLPLVSAALQLPAVQRFMGGVPPVASGDGHATPLATPPASRVQEAHVVETAPADGTAAHDAPADVSEDEPDPDPRLIHPIEPVAVDYAPALTGEALKALTLPQATDEGDARWAAGIAQWAQQPEVRRDLSASTLVRVLASLATEAAVKQIPTARIGALTARLADALGYADDLRAYTAAPPAAVVTMLRPLLRRWGVELPPAAETVLKAVISTLKKSLK